MLVLDVLRSYDGGMELLLGVAFARSARRRSSFEHTRDYPLALGADTVPWLGGHEVSLFVR